ncbi:MAG: rhomboid family intramembrane serine protease [Rubritalea sp.]|uniref:rhomboid family intramembrane serine protease n=1 Tax=Rubritalea sp. TaxID=2109375 RepID=UPI003242FF6C
MSQQEQAPLWARPEAFPAKPVVGVFGFQDTKGKRHSAESLEELCQMVEHSKLGVDLVWSPPSDYMIAPEELVGLRKVLIKRGSVWARNDINDGCRLSLVMGAAILWAGYAAYQNNHGDWRAILNAPTVAVTAIMMLIFGLLPLYEGWQELRKAGKRDKLYWDKEIANARFDSWLNLNLTPVTFVLLTIMVITCAAQWFASGGINWAQEAVAKVGLVKSTTAGGDPWWRYLTAPLVHGNLVHALINFASLRYLGRRAEVLARWPHMVLVFVISSFAGGMATVYFMPDIPSVGASGGVLGLLGFLLAFETLHRALVPKSARKRLVAGLVMVAVMGVLGFSFIDNAAHAGGLIAGVVYALIVFPPSASLSRPDILKKDRIVGACGLTVLVVSAALCVRLLLR